MSFALFGKAAVTLKQCDLSRLRVLNWCLISESRPQCETVND